MLNLREYSETQTLLADYLPWACLVAPGVVLARVTNRLCITKHNTHIIHT